MPPARGRQAATLRGSGDGGRTGEVSSGSCATNGEFVNGVGAARPPALSGAPQRRSSSGACSIDGSASDVPPEIGDAEIAAPMSAAAAATCARSFGEAPMLRTLAACNSIGELLTAVERGRLPPIVRRKFHATLDGAAGVHFEFAPHPAGCTEHFWPLVWFQFCSERESRRMEALLALGHHRPAAGPGSRRIREAAGGPLDSPFEALMSLQPPMSRAAAVAGSSVPEASLGILLPPPFAAIDAIPGTAGRLKASDSSQPCGSVTSPCSLAGAQVAVQSPRLAAGASSSAAPAECASGPEGAARAEAAAMNLAGFEEPHARTFEHHDFYAEGSGDLMEMEAALALPAASGGGNDPQASGGGNDNNTPAASSGGGDQPVSSTGSEFAGADPDDAAWWVGDESSDEDEDIDGAAHGLVDGRFTRHRDRCDLGRPLQPCPCMCVAPRVPHARAVVSWPALGSRRALDSTRHDTQRLSERQTGLFVPSSAHQPISQMRVD